MNVVLDAETRGLLEKWRLEQDVSVSQLIRDCIISGDEDANAKLIRDLRGLVAEQQGHIGKLAKALEAAQQHTLAAERLRADISGLLSPLSEPKAQKMSLAQMKKLETVQRDIGLVRRRKMEFLPVIDEHVSAIREGRAPQALHTANVLLELREHYGSWEALRQAVLEPQPEVPAST